MLVAAVVCAAALGGQVEAVTRIRVVSGNGAVRTFRIPSAPPPRPPAAYSLLGALADPTRRRWVPFSAEVSGKAVFHAGVPADEACKVPARGFQHVVDLVCGSDAVVGAGQQGREECGRFVIRAVRRAAAASCEDMPRLTASSYLPPIVMPDVADVVCVLEAGGRFSRQALAASASAALLLSELRRPLPPAPPLAGSAGASPPACDRPLVAHVGVFAYDASRLHHVDRWVRRLAGPDHPCWSFRLHVHAAAANGSWPEDEPCAGTAVAWLAGRGGRRDLGADVTSTAFRVASRKAEDCAGVAVGGGTSPAALPGHAPLAAMARRWKAEAAAAGAAGAPAEGWPPRLSVSVWLHPGELGRLFAWSARRRTLAEADAWPAEPDALAFFEEDHHVEPGHFDRHLRWSRLLPDTVLPGLLQVEEAVEGSRGGGQWGSGDRVVISATPGRGHGSLLLRVPSRAGEPEQLLLASGVGHQGGFLVAGRGRLAGLRRSGCLTAGFVSHWLYPVIEAADSQVWYNCSATRAVPVPLVREEGGRVRAVRRGDPTWGEWSGGGGTLLGGWREAWQVHHAPDKYVRTQGGSRLELFPLSDEALLQWAGAC